MKTTKYSSHGKEENSGVSFLKTDTCRLNYYYYYYYYYYVDYDGPRRLKCKCLLPLKHCRRAMFPVCELFLRWADPSKREPYIYIYIYL
jgi:hypothetical protein